MIGSSGSPLSPAACAQIDGILGVDGAAKLWSDLVALAPTNLEDPVGDRWEKPNYRATADYLEDVARRWGFSVRRYDPSELRRNDAELRGIPRPNLIVDSEVDARARILVLAHYDVVPVSAEQLTRWQSPPHALRLRSDGRLYGRGSNDDLGSGVVASLVAARRLASGGQSPRNVRLLICCDEETGGSGGIESLKAHDAALPPRDPERFVEGDAVLIPDGAPYVAAGSSGVLFLDATFERPVPLISVLDYGEELMTLHERVREWRSALPSPEWPHGGAPEPVITGRATVTKWELEASSGTSSELEITRARAETDATNLIADTVTLVLTGTSENVEALVRFLEHAVRPPFEVGAPVATSLEVPDGARAVSIRGKGFHAGSPHHARNPVPETLRILREAARPFPRLLEERATAAFGIDVRLPPEMPLGTGRDAVLTGIEERIRTRSLPAQIAAPQSRCRGGYAIAVHHPAVRRLASILLETMGSGRVFGEYGGTDASSLVGLTTPGGDPLPALVFGSMDRRARIHEAEESADPKLVAAVAESIRRFVADP